MNKKFTPETYPILSNIIDNINNTLECQRFQEFSNSIDIDTWENVEETMQNNRNTADNGFSFCISNYFENGDFKRIIIINTENCNQLELSEREITAVIFHELGHLLNSPLFENEPTIMFCMKNKIDYNKNLHDEVRKNNSILNEVYADSYANQYGYGTEIISTFDKHNEHFDEEIGYYEIRVQKINDNELVEGIVKPINTNGW